MVNCIIFIISWLISSAIFFFSSGLEPVLGMKEVSSLIAGLPLGILLYAVLVSIKEKFVDKIEFDIESQNWNNPNYLKNVNMKPKKKPNLKLIK